MTFAQLLNTVPVEFGKQFISFVTGQHNDNRISLKYYHHQASGTVYAEVTFGKLAQGPPGHAHGGAISAVFDELMGACCWVNDQPAMTAQYTTRFFKPVPLNTKMLYCADIKKVEANKISLEAKLIDVSESKYAEARGLFILQDMETFKRMSQSSTDNEDFLKELAKHT
ncbi:MAG: PaaI family thioesterase [Candidatus Marinimicrobia bacterium]|nr:PaaI family thioesterase [Candidatus Neomarinimicrobiota bacterium]